jgi:hypothetical protein
MRQISETALEKRISRKLAHDGLALRKSRPFTWSEANFGARYVLDIRRNMVVEKDVDLETIGRDLEVLADNETLAS